VTVRLTAGDFCAWAQHQQARSFAKRCITGAVSGAVLLVGIFILAGNPPRYYPMAALIGAAFAAVVGLVTSGWEWFTAPLEARKICAQDPSLLWERTLSPARDGLQIEDRGDQRLIPWRDFKALTAAHGYLFFELGREKIIIIPRAAFPSPAASQRFLGICESCAGQRAPDGWAPPSGDQITPGERGLTPTGPPVAEGWAPPPLGEQITPGERGLTASFEITSGDTAQLRREVVAQAGRDFLHGLKTRPIWPISFAMLLVGVANSRGWPGVLVCLGLGGLMAFLWFGFQSWRAQRRFSQPEGGQDVTASPTGLGLRQRGVLLSRYSWKQLKGVRRRSGYVLFRTDDGVVVGIPERAFSSTDAVNEFEAQAGRWIAGEQ
jgi:hypothetical protein